MVESSQLIGAVDLGGTKIYSAVLDQSNRVLGDDLRATEADSGPNAVLERLIDSLATASLKAGTPVTALRGLGIAAPGPVDPATGHLLDPPNLSGWGDVALGPIVSERLGLQVAVENDAKAAALGEYASGNGSDAKVLLYVTVSTGIGGGIVLDGRPFHGAAAAAGEIGHMCVQPRGPRCGCGRRGCLEALASGTAIARDALTALAADRTPVLKRQVQENHREVTAELVAEAATNGDTVAAGIIRQAGVALGIALGSIANILNPDVIVVGGGVARIGPPLLGPAEKRMRRIIFARPAKGLELRPSALDYAAIAGLAQLVRAS